MIEICDWDGISKKHENILIKRMNHPDKDGYLANLINECQQKSNRTYGCRRVKIWLEKYKNIFRCTQTVLRIMNKYGLLSEIRRRLKYRKMGEDLYKYENLLNRNFHAEKPNLKRVTDISYIQTAEGTLYLSNMS